MRNYLDDYFNSLSSGQQLLAKDFVWKYRQQALDFATNTSLRDIRYTRARPGNIFEYNDINGLLEGAFSSIASIATQVDKTAAIRGAVEIQSNDKLKRIEAALKALDIEVTSWLDDYVSKPEASGIPIKRSFGETGIRPINEMDNILSLLSTVVVANTDFNTDGSIVYCNAPDRVVEPLFCEDEGFQSRITYNFVAGNVTRIHLEPINGIGSITLKELRAYDTNGNIVATLAQDEELTRTLEYSIPRTMICRLEADLLDTTYHLVQVPENVRHTGTRRQVIPAHTEEESYTETVTLYWRAIEAFNLTPYQVELLGQLYDNRGGVEGIIYAFSHPEIPDFQEISNVLNVALNGVFDRFSWDDAGLREYIDNLFKIQYGGTETVTKYRWTEIPEKVLLTPYYYDAIDQVTRYRYCVGFNNISCINDFYTEIYRVTEDITFEGGLPTTISLSTDEYIPAGSYINFFLIDKEGNTVPLLPDNREFTTDVLPFNEIGQADLLFYPSGATYFYKNTGESVELAINGRSVMGPSANLGSLNTMAGADTYWARYQPDRTRANTIPQGSRTSSYISESGIFGEVFPKITSSKSLALKFSPYIDWARIGESGYSPVQVVIDGYTTVDTTKYDNTYEEEFPVQNVYYEGKRLIHYKVRDKIIYFESELDRQVRILYEYVSGDAKLMIEMGVLHGKAAAPVLYQYSISYR